MSVKVFGIGTDGIKYQEEIENVSGSKIRCANGEQLILNVWLIFLYGLLGFEIGLIYKWYDSNLRMWVIIINLTTNLSGP
jgi:hypothetical protein